MQTAKMAENVWLFVPNLIGYVRFITGFAAFWYAFDPATTPLFFGLYLLSYALDACDGVAARRLKQTSRFGAVLDMVCDRICTAALLAALAHTYVDKSTALSFAFIMLMMLDVGSHWVQMYAQLLLGAASHKNLADEHPLVKLYYNWVYLFTICLANETCLVMLFLVRAAERAGPSVIPAPFGVTIPLGWLPALGVSSAPLHTVLAAMTSPVFALKQVISVLQMVTAAKRIVANDQKERAAAAAHAPAVIQLALARRQTSSIAVPSSSPRAASPAAGRGRSKSPAVPKSAGRKRA